MIFRRVMFWLLIPAIAVLAGILTAMNVLMTERRASIDMLVLLVFGYVLLGSMTLNGWLALRHPDSLAVRALPLRLSFAHAVLYASMALWFTTIATGSAELEDGSFSAAVLILCVLLMAASIAAFVLVADRAWAGPTQRIVTVPATRGLVTGVSIYVGGAIALSAIYFAVRNVENDGLFTFALMLFGLPWSHTQYFLTAWPIAAVASSVLTSTLLIPVAVNVGLAIALLASGRFRTGFTNWFFRLGRPAPENKVPTGTALADEL